MYVRVHPLTARAVRMLAERTHVAVQDTVDRLLRDALQLPQDALGIAITSNLPKNRLP
jgi:hypothetical protein